MLQMTTSPAPLLRYFRSNRGQIVAGGTIVLHSVVAMDSQACHRMRWPYDDV